MATQLAYMWSTCRLIEANVQALLVMQPQPQPWRHAAAAGSSGSRRRATAVHGNARNSPVTGTTLSVSTVTGTDTLVRSAGIALHQNTWRDPPVTVISPSGSTVTTWSREALAVSAGSGRTASHMSGCLPHIAALWVLS